MTNEVILNRLNQLNISISDILEKVRNIDKDITDYTMFLYCSQIEGLGTAYSDFDIYVIHNGKKRGNRVVYELKLNEVPLDVEIWHEEQVSDIIQRLKKEVMLPVDLTKFLYRLSISEIVENDTYGNAIKSNLDKSLIHQSAKVNFYSDIIGTTEDCMSLFNAKDYESALILARHIVQCSVAVLNIDKGNVNLKPKWITRIFLNNNGYNVDFLTRYENLYLYPKVTKETLSSHIEELLSFSQDILSGSLFD